MLYTRSNNIRKEVFMTLVILAAGLGSRYGGLKQLDPVGECGEFIIDYSVYDAIKAGFDKVVFIIRKHNLEIFKETIGNRISPFIKVEYAFQEPDYLPEGFVCPESRTRPWGTTHALLCAKDSIDEAFAVINADDFYGRGAYAEMAKRLPSLSGENAIMIGYRIENTLSENGSVSRGICEMNGDTVESITEHKKIYEKGGRIFCECKDSLHEIERGSFASMNFFGLTKELLLKFEKSFLDFIKVNLDSEKAECYLPESTSKQAETITLYPTSEKWFGVTYKEDKASTVAKIKEMTEKGIYPVGLWK